MNQPECGCILNINCPLHKAAPEMYKVLLAVYQEVDLIQLSDELNFMVSQALAKAEGKEV